MSSVRAATIARPLEVRSEAPGFTVVPTALSRVAFQNSLAFSRHFTNQILLNGSGVAAGDVDGDGLVDLYFCALDGNNLLYHNLGNWRFEDVTARAGAARTGLAVSGVLLVDVDGDADLDLVVGSVGGGTQLLFNDGRGRFRAGKELLNDALGAASLAAADLDGNGTVDLYISNYRAVTLRDQPNTRFNLRMVEGRPVVTSVNGRSINEPDLAHRFEFKIGLGNGQPTFVSDENGEPDAVLLNDGQGGFTPLSFTNGAFLDESGRALRLPPFDWGLSVTLRDLNGDGAPDIFVCNDFKSPDRIWMNDGAGRFRALPATALRQTSFSSMGIDVADINRDGHFDFFVVDMLSRDHRRRLSQRSDFPTEAVLQPGDRARVQSSRNTLQLARGDGTFAEIAQFAGLPAADWAWTPLFLDVDLDGYEDLLISNGFERDGMNADVLREIENRKTSQKLSAAEQLGLRKLFPRLATPNAAYRNLGGLRFSDTSVQWGFDLAGVSQGMALADLDGDGDQDVIICNLNDPVVLLRNNCGAPRVAVRLKGLSPNTRGLGARITVHGGPVVQMQEMVSGGRYLSCDDAMRVFAAGSLTNKLRIEVTWRSGRQTLVTDARPNHLYVIDESESVPPERVRGSPPAVTLFQDMSTELNHRHEEQPFDDFSRQPLLSRKLSQPGPGVSWADLDADGWDDLIVGAGKGGHTAAFRNGRNGSFTRWSGPPFDQEITRDQTAILACRRATNDVVLLAGASNYEDGITGGAMVRLFEFVGGRVLDQAPGFEASVGPLVLGDVNGDGTLDLFAGGGARAGRFPEPASSLLLLGRAGQFVPDPANTGTLAGIGLVNGAVLTDLDNDGDPDLVVACDWGPLKIFRNDLGVLAFWNAPIQFESTSPHLPAFSAPHPRPSMLSELTGWWQGLAAGDFDGDGRMDFLAANWGENTEWEMFRARPLRLYYADFDGDGSIEMIQSHYEPALNGYVPLMNYETALRGLPWLRPRFPTWKSYGEATVEHLLGPKSAAAKIIEANWLATTLFLNRGDRFTVVRLPDEAQFAPAFGVCVADFDGDGLEDVFLAQNFFAVAPEWSRQDAGRGLLLRGDGRGGLRPVPASESGLEIYGEQRGVASGDFDRDGRMDLVVGQNGAATRLFRNANATPGLRVRLAGSAGNLDAIGTSLRAVRQGRPGPARAVTAGSGWLSQNSFVQIVPADAEALLVRWPGGRETRSAIPSGAREVVLDSAGKPSVVR